MIFGGPSGYSDFSAIDVYEHSITDINIVSVGESENSNILGFTPYYYTQIIVLYEGDETSLGIKWMKTP